MSNRVGREVVGRRRGGGGGGRRGSKETKVYEGGTVIAKNNAHLSIPSNPQHIKLKKMKKLDVYEYHPYSVLLTCGSGSLVQDNVGS